MHPKYACSLNGSLVALIGTASGWLGQLRVAATLQKLTRPERGGEKHEGEKNTWKRKNFNPGPRTTWVELVTVARLRHAKR
jgi:hypothetical protein